MPLHLLGKKSWNVYNSDNVARVRRDEAEAQARQEAIELRMQEEDAARRIAILRGDPLPPPSRVAPAQDASPSRDRDDRPRKRRRVRGEDDTDRDIRHAREDEEAARKARETLVQRREDDTPLHDHAGHIQLIAPPDEKDIRKAQKDAEAQKTNKRKQEEDQSTLRFKHAAGFRNGTNTPWYTSSTRTKPATAEEGLSSVQEKDVWGNEDPLRREREHTRISTNDPFAAMQRAQRQLKQSEADREKWKKKRLAEVEDIQREEDRQSRRDRKKLRRRSGSADSLESFELDALAEKTNDGNEYDSPRRHGQDRLHRHRHNGRDARRRRRKSRSRSRDRRQ